MSKSEHAWPFSDGYVGIGNGVSPVAPLHVVGQATRQMTRAGYFSTERRGDQQTRLDYVSIKSEWYIEAFGFIAVSDGRIKDMVANADTAEELKTIQKLQVRNYRMKDRVQAGNSRHKGFIAQEVQDLIPEAVQVGRDFVPSIYAQATALAFDKEMKTLRVTLDKAHDLADGDTVRLFADDSSHDLKVSAVPTSTSFVVGPIDDEPQQVFVFGKQVDDFLSLDYNRIFTTGIAAIQQLKIEKDAEVQKLEEDNTSLRSQLAAVEQRLAGLEARDTAREAKLAAIEKLLEGRASLA